ncbi:MAG TPA: pyridoxal-phosphate dependent enzyme [Candidatus Dormibacteraeota bacterium]|nr:pyridoxal-phosphate dependent enzyme [Candidatus Dormibacteraeota bacterium]
MSGTAGEGLWEPTLRDVLAAQRRIRPHLAPTPLRPYPSLGRLVGAEIWVKHDNLQPTGAFKVRGGINLISQLDEDTRRRGVIAASTGNHGQSVAYAARRFGVRAVVCVPERANPVKVEGVRQLGAEVVLAGRDYDQARERCEELARARGHRYIHSGDEPDLIAGVGTHTLELLEEQPDVEAIVVPVGGGSGAAGAAIVAKAIDARIAVYAVGSAQAPAAHDAWREGRPVERPNATRAEGLATGTSFELPQRIMRRLLDDFVLVEDVDLFRAARLMIEATRTLVEPAGAAALAAALSPGLAPRLRGRKVALICTGANLSPAQLRDLMASG